MVNLCPLPLYQGADTVSLYDLTAEGYSWTRDFCRWYFHIDLSEFDEGVCYVYPRRWKKETDDSVYDRAYLFLYREQQNLFSLGYINVFTGCHVISCLNQRYIEWMKITKFVEENWLSLANIARYGIEGCLMEPDREPVASLFQHVLGHAHADETSEDEWFLQWPSFPRGLDARTELEFNCQVLRGFLSKNGIEVLTDSSGYASVKAINDTGREWLVNRTIDNKTEEEYSTD